MRFDISLEELLTLRKHCLKVIKLQKELPRYFDGQLINKKTIAVINRLSAEHDRRIALNDTPRRIK